MYTGPNNGQGSGFYVQRPQQQGYEEYMHDIEAKEAALKGFGVGLAIGLGALGSLTGLLKLIWIPLLALGALLPLLLLFTTPIPVISMGKMLLGSVNVKQARLQVSTFIIIMLECFIYKFLRLLGCNRGSYEEVAGEFKQNFVCKRVIINF